ncbi:MAG TPA: mechanosensitive ion channel family protein, partial [Gemmatimonadota bacterium]|nr:mechanosensitive ion channel family protein [Gemmatimonadota bacterium]
MTKALSGNGAGPLGLGLRVDWSGAGDRLLKVAVILILAWVVYRGIVVLTRRIERSVVEGGSGGLSAREQRGRTLAQIVRNASTVALTVLAGVACLTVFVPNASAPLAAAVGVLGLALSFGAQALVKDLISGFFMLVEGQYQVGDVIRINESTAGQVEKVTMRVVVLRDVHGVVHTIPNGQINQVSNLTKGWSRAVLEVGVAYGEDVDRVMEVLADIGRGLWEDQEWRPLLVEEPVVPGVERFDDSAVVVRFMAKT